MQNANGLAPACHQSALFCCFFLVFNNKPGIVVLKVEVHAAALEAISGLMRFALQAFIFGLGVVGVLEPFNVCQTIIEIHGDFLTSHIKSTAGFLLNWQQHRSWTRAVWRNSLALGTFFNGIGDNADIKSLLVTAAAIAQLGRAEPGSFRSILHFNQAGFQTACGCLASLAGTGNTTANNL